MKRRCPVCHKVVEVASQERPKEAKFFPFCSRRCKLLDLGAWLDAEYKIICEPQPPESDEPADSFSETPSERQ